MSPIFLDKIVESDCIKNHIQDCSFSHTYYNHIHIYSCLCGLVPTVFSMYLEGKHEYNLYYSEEFHRGISTPSCGSSLHGSNVTWGSPHPAMVAVCIDQISQADSPPSYGSSLHGSNVTWEFPHPAVVAVCIDHIVQGGLHTAMVAVCIYQITQWSFPHTAMVTVCTD